VYGVGNEERAAMYLELEEMARELKELEWRLEKFHELIADIDFSLKGGVLQNVLERLEKPDAEEFLKREALAELIRRILRLRGKKIGLEKKLGLKITLE